MLLLLAVEQVPSRRVLAIKEGSCHQGGFLPSKRALGHAIAACAIKAWAIKAGVIEVDSRSYC
jgi:hypothetical protein